VGHVIPSTGPVYTICSLADQHLHRVEKMFLTKYHAVFALQKKIWCLHCRGNFAKGTLIKSVFDYRFNSNKHIHMFLFVTQAFCVFIVRIWVCLVCNLGLFEITE